MEHKTFNSNGYNSSSEFVLSPEDAKRTLELLLDDLIYEEKVLTELDGVIEIENIKSIIDYYFNNTITNFKR